MKTLMIISASICMLLSIYNVNAEVSSSVISPSSVNKYLGIIPSGVENDTSELKVDDGTAEDIISGRGFIIVNRLTPANYPSTLKSVRIFFRQVNPTPIGSQIRLLAFINNAGAVSEFSSPVYVLDKTVTIPVVSTIGEFIDFPIENGPTINSGDFVVGFQQLANNGVPTFWADSNGTQENRGYASPDGGSTFQGDVRINRPGFPSANFMIRATVSSPATFTAVSAASFTNTGLSSQSIVAGFGESLASQTVIASSLPLPLSLDGTSVVIKDRLGTEKLAPLLFVSTSQVNFITPDNLSYGDATVEVRRGGSVVSSGRVVLRQTSSGLFSANSDGKGVPAGSLLRTFADGTSRYEPISKYDDNQKKFVPLPINIGSNSGPTFLILNGTGIRGRNSTASVSVKMGNINVPVVYAGEQGEFVGLDQINVEIPTALSGRGEVPVSVTIDGVTSNELLINIGSNLQQDTTTPKRALTKSKLTQKSKKISNKKKSSKNKTTKSVVRKFTIKKVKANNVLVFK